MMGHKARREDVGVCKFGQKSSSRTWKEITWKEGTKLVTLKDKVRITGDVMVRLGNNRKERRKSQ